jgi:hypothetical protein
VNNLKIENDTMATHGLKIRLDNLKKNSIKLLKSALFSNVKIEGFNTYKCNCTRTG